MTTSAILLWLGSPTIFWVGLIATLVGTALWEAAARAPATRMVADNDRRIMTNAGLAVLWLLLTALIPTTATSLAAYAQRHGIGLFPSFGMSGWPAIVASLLVLDAGYYGMHRLAHRWDWLWRLHRVHHCDTALDISTAFRHHPIDLLVSLALTAALTVVFGLSALSIPIYALIAVLLSIPQHADLLMSNALEAKLSGIVVTPGVHRIHHGADISDTDSNYGGVLTVWDWLFGTLQQHSPRKRVDMRIGLGPDHDHHADNILRQLTGPLRP